MMLLLHNVYWVSYKNESDNSLGDAGHHYVPHETFSLREVPTLAISLGFCTFHIFLGLLIRITLQISAL